MTVQAPESKSDKQKKQKRFLSLPWTIVSFIIVAVIIFIVVSLVSLKVQGTSQGINTLTILSIITGGVVGLIGLLFSFLQWHQSRMAHPPNRVRETAAANSDSFMSITSTATLEKKEGSGVLVVSKECQIDWGEAPEATQFYGREKELASLKKSVVEGHCHMVALLGIGGIGKTCLTAVLVDQIKDHFDYVFWRSLQNTPSLESIVKKCILFLSDQQQADLPENLNEQLSLLTNYLRQRRCLLILDNVEAILQSGDHTGVYQEGYEGYGKLIQQVGEVRHQSCLILTSREKIQEVVRLEAAATPIRSYNLSGLSSLEGLAILRDKGLSGSDEELVELIHLYAGNPLALKLVSEIVFELFDGDVSAFLQKRSFGVAVHELLQEQFERLSALERKIMYWLAIERDTVSFEYIYEDIVGSVTKYDLLEALASLRRRAMIEISGSTGFLLQPVIMEYVTHKFVRLINGEIVTERLELFVSHALMQAQAKDYIRESQIRLILAPIADQLCSTIGEAETEQKLKRLLTLLKRMPYPTPGYAAGNILNLLIYLKADLHGWDFSHLTIWQAYLQEVELPEVNFAFSYIAKSVFTDTFGGIFSLTLSRDGSLLAAGNGNGEIRFWKVDGGLPTRSHSAHSSWIWSLEFDPNGTRMVSACEDQTVCLWDVSSGNCLGTLHGHTDRVRSVAFSPDGRFVASGGQDRTVRVWDVSEKPHLKMLLTHDAWVYSVKFSPDGKRLATGNEDGSVRLWDLGTGCCIASWYGHTHRVYSLAFSPDGGTLISGSGDNTIRLWDVESGCCLKVLTGHTNRIRSVAFHPDGKTIVSGSEDQTVRLWDSSVGRCLHILLGHNTWVRSVVFSSDGEIVISGSEDQTIRFWEISTGRCLITLQGFINPIWSVAFSVDGKTVASGGEDQAVRLWDIDSGGCIRELKKHTHSVWGVAFSPDGRFVASVSGDQSLCLWEVASGHYVKVLTGHSNCIWGIAFSPDGSLIASGSDDQTVRLWDVSTGKCLKELTGHTNEIRSVAFSPNGKLLASGSEDQTIRLWEVDTGKALGVWNGHTNWVRCVTFSPDGMLLASGSDDQTVRLWNASTGEQLLILQDDASWVYWVTFSPNGKLLASANGDHTIRLWDVMDTRMISTMHGGHTNRVRAVAFNPEGNRLVSGSEDGKIILWDVQNGTVIKTFKCDGPYERMDITGVKGLNEAQKATLKALGAVEGEAVTK